MSTMNELFGADDIIFATHSEADEALFELKERAGKYEYVTVADLQEIAGLKASPMDEKYIWTRADLKHGCIVRIRDGFMVSLPRPVMKPAPSTAKVTYRTYYDQKPKPKTTPKTLTISINANVDDFDNALAKAIQYAQTIADREVKIDIC